MIKPYYTKKCIMSNRYAIGLRTNNNEHIPTVSVLFRLFCVRYGLIDCSDLCTDKYRDAFALAKASLYLSVHKSEQSISP